ncbi:hypothetical protein AA21291_1242 [Swaminathania salitolerans LMG 21291]|nr:hypothetical protein AA21291_1242 [Swaminathania salitolerans LMG 21291]
MRLLLGLALVYLCGMGMLDAFRTGHKGPVPIAGYLGAFAVMPIVLLVVFSLPALGRGRVPALLLPGLLPSLLLCARIATSAGSFLHA